jgi:hypothetical protein
MEIEAAGFRLLQAYLAAAGLCARRPYSEDQPPHDPSYTVMLSTADGAVRVTFAVEYTEGPTNYQLTFECFDAPYGPEALVVLLVAISDVATYVLATFASLQYEEIALIYNTPNVSIDALPPSDEQLQAVLTFLLDPGMEPGGCRATDDEEPG